MIVPGRDGVGEFGNEGAYYISVRQVSKSKLERVPVAIQKKSLISNRTATKKALVAKPEVTNKPGVSRLAPVRLAPVRLAPVK